jgi:hypothetical protein
VHGFVQGRQRLRTQERRREQLVLGRDLDVLGCKLEDDSAVDDESAQATGYVTAAQYSRPASTRGLLPHAKLVSNQPVMGVRVVP